MSTTEDLELARRLAHEIGMQAQGTKDSERQLIQSMAQIIERLLTGADDEDRQRGRDLLHPSAG